MGPGQVVMPGLNRDGVPYWIPAGVYPDEIGGGMTRNTEVNKALLKRTVWIYLGSFEFIVWIYLDF